MLNHHGAVGGLLHMWGLLYCVCIVLWLKLITCALTSCGIALHIDHATRAGQLMCLSFLKLRISLLENNLLPFPLHMKETYFDIVLLFLFHVDILLILSLYLLLMLCVHSFLHCVCVTASDYYCVLVNLWAYLNGLMSVVCCVCMGLAFSSFSSLSQHATNISELVNQNLHHHFELQTTSLS